MRKPDLFDEIIVCLKEMSAAEVSAETLDALFGEAPAKKQVPAPVQTPPQQAVIVPAERPAPAAVMPAARPVPVSASGTVNTLDWESLHQATMCCEKCRLCQTRTNVVFGDGNPDARIMFIGEGPGRDEDLQGLPFVGRAGELLTRMIGAMGLDRKKDVYIANIVKCRPPENRNPEPDEAKMCLPYLERQIGLVKPQVIVLLGAVPLLYLLNQRGISRVHGTWFDYHGIRMLPTFHPAFLLRDPRKKADAWHDLQIVMRELGLPIPEKHKNT